MPFPQPPASGATVSAVRKQYHFRPSGRGLHAWDVDRLIDLAADLPIEEVALSAFDEVDTDYWFGHGYRPTVRAVVEHVRLVNHADLSYPIILDPDGRVMDGMHRVARALLEGRSTITAKRLTTMPAPDRSDVQPDDLPQLLRLDLGARRARDQL